MTSARAARGRLGASRLLRWRRPLTGPRVKVRDCVGEQVRDGDGLPPAGA
eukprot:CAMPEP_0185523372 /NCGR_PEP_ID=MMETSP1366-20130426/85228_1 /TAXON_ID=38817 /ORGANISM="Gephyrocapsa oceanica, Strain RCC1303" /LENGTH=49 /DNA_ID= /DNA_START= /DNA_END= /DNA_ORIENTATION=